MIGEVSYFSAQVI